MSKLIIPLMVIIGSVASAYTAAIANGSYEQNPAWWAQVIIAAVFGLGGFGVAGYRTIKGKGGDPASTDDDVPAPITDPKRKDDEAIYWLTERLRDDAAAVKNLQSIDACLFCKHHKLGGGDEK